MLLPNYGCSLELCIPFLKLTNKEQASISWKPGPLAANVTRLVQLLTITCVLSNKGKGMQSSSEQPLVGEERYVTTLITAAKETIDAHARVIAITWTFQPV